MGAAYHLVVLPPIAIEIFPLAGAGIEDVLDPTHLPAPPTNDFRTLFVRPNHGIAAIPTMIAKASKPIMGNSTQSYGEGCWLSTWMKNAARSAASASVM